MTKSSKSYYKSYIDNPKGRNKKLEYILTFVVIF